jgi:hypothetical protein
MSSACRITASLALLVFALTLGCASKPGATPEGAFAELQAAFDKGDHGAVYDLMSRRSRDAFTREISGMAEQMKNIPPFARQVLQFDFEELAALPPRDAFAKMMSGVKDSAKLGNAMTGKASPQASPFAGATVKGCDSKGDTAVITVTVGDAERSLEFVLEDGLWKIATPLAPRVGK